MTILRIITTIPLTLSSRTTIVRITFTPAIIWIETIFAIGVLWINIRIQICILIHTGYICVTTQLHVRHIIHILTQILTEYIYIYIVVRTRCSNYRHIRTT